MEPVSLEWSTGRSSWEAIVRILGDGAVVVAGCGAAVSREPAGAQAPSNAKTRRMLLVQTRFKPIVIIKLLCRKCGVGHPESSEGSVPSPGPGFPFASLRACFGLRPQNDTNAALDQHCLPVRIEGRQTRRDVLHEKLPRTPA